MRQRIWRALRLVLLMALCGAGPVLAQQAAPSTYVPAVRVFVGEMVRAHLLALRCADEARRPGGKFYEWDETRATLVASLWANGYPDDFVREIDTHMSIQAKQAPCDDAAMEAYRASGVAGGTLKWVNFGFAGIGLVIVEPPAEGSWDKIVAAFAEQNALQSRKLACFAVVKPLSLPNLVGSWSQMLQTLGPELIEHGYPRPDVAAQIEAADPNLLWQPVAEEGRAALTEDCGKDQAWLDGPMDMGQDPPQLQRDIEALLPAPKATR